MMSIDALMAQSMLAVESSKQAPKIESRSSDGKIDEAKLREQTDAFESIIIKMMLDISMSEEKNIFTQQSDPAQKIYGSMYREELANASSGGFGFSQMLFEHLMQKSSL